VTGARMGPLGPVIGLIHAAVGRMPHEGSKAVAEVRTRPFWAPSLAGELPGEMAKSPTSRNSSVMIARLFRY
jgi:hypothetical protein